MVNTARWIAIASTLIAIPSAALGHPLHTSLAQMTVDARSRAVKVSLRVFVDDFTAAATDWSKTNRAGPTTTLFAYARASFVVRESTGRIVPLEFCGEKRVGDLLYVCLTGRISANNSVSSVVSRVLTEKFDDQVNIVQAVYSGRKANLLFTPGDGEKRLP